MRRALAIVTVAALGLVGAGCGEPSDSTPVACLEGGGTYVKALGDAPNVVKLRDEALISECLVENQQAGDLATVGTALVSATTRLNAEARAEPGGDANLQLGYLLGAAERGAEHTDGIHAELTRRLSAAARYSPDNRSLPPAFLSTYREGFDAGQARG
jgi:hypothetical protein